MWHEPFASADCGGDEALRFTSTAARSLAEDAGLVVEAAAADGGYAAVLCDVIGIDVNDDACRAAAEPSTPIDTKGGFYLASAMLARRPGVRTSSHLSTR